MALPTKKRMLPNHSSNPKKNNMGLPNLDDVQDTQNKKNNSVIQELDFEEINDFEKSEYFDVNPKPVTRPPIPTDDRIKGHETTPFIEEPNPDNDYRNGDDDKFIDKKDMKIIPIGGKKARAKNFDKRKNLLVPLKLFRFLLFVVILGLFGIGIKNTFYPSNNFTKEEIELFATNAVGQTGFPVERGKAFAEDFMKYYLSLDPENATTKAIMGEFYGGTDKGSGDKQSVSLELFNNNKQVVIGEPRVFEIINVDPKSALYKVSALVSDETGNITTGERNEIPTSHWISFAINVYYDEVKDRLSVPPGNPYLIPTKEFDGYTNTPEGAALGNGESANDEMGKKLFPTIAGYLKAYANASNSSHNDIIQYIPENPTSDLYNGFGGNVQLAREDNQAIKYKIFKTDDGNVWKIDVNVDWLDTKSVTSSQGAIYTARYVMTIEKVGKKYLVTKFSPYVYVPKEKTTN